MRWVKCLLRNPCSIHVSAGLFSLTSGAMWNSREMIRSNSLYFGVLIYPSMAVHIGLYSYYPSSYGSACSSFICLCVFVYSSSVSMDMHVHLSYINPLCVYTMFLLTLPCTCVSVYLYLCILINSITAHTWTSIGINHSLMHVSASPSLYLSLVYWY